MRLAVVSLFLSVSGESFFYSLGVFEHGASEGLLTDIRILLNASALTVQAEDSSLQADARKQWGLSFL